jgi:NAD-dependent dihydropyrimidine dehydrogenase PreA subunit
MVFYFSGTGNSKWVAQGIADTIRDIAYNISALADIPDICAEQHIGFVFPIYAWGIPEPMRTFIKRLPKTNAFTFAVCTCGEDAGKALKQCSKLYHLDSSYSVTMPSNYIAGANLEDEKVIVDKITSAKNELAVIADEILEQKNVYRVHEGAFAILKTNLAHRGFNTFARTTKPFYATDPCNACGLCAKDCPAKAIKLVDGKPAWNSKCYQCLRCINACPQAAIQYGKATEARGRYNIQNFL